MDGLESAWMDAKMVSKCNTLERMRALEVHLSIETANKTVNEVVFNWRRDFNRGNSRQSSATATAIIDLMGSHLRSCCFQSRDERDSKSQSRDEQMTSWSKVNDFFQQQGLRLLVPIQRTLTVPQPQSLFFVLCGLEKKIPRESGRRQDLRDLWSSVLQKVREWREWINICPVKWLVCIMRDD